MTNCGEQRTQPPRWSQDLGLLAMRLGFGVTMFASHGLGKLGHLLAAGTEEFQFPDPLGIGPTAGFVLIAFAEGVCSLLVACGLFTRLACIPLVIGMGVAAYTHAAKGDPFGTMEFPLLYAMAFVVLAIAGPGRLALDTYAMPRVRRLWGS